MDKTLNDYPDILKPNDIMNILQIGRSTCYNLLYGGFIPSIRIGKQYRITKKSLAEYLDLPYDNNADGLPRREFKC